MPEFFEYPYHRTSFVINKIYEPISLLHGAGSAARASGSTEAWTDPHNKSEDSRIGESLPTEYQSALCSSLLFHQETVNQYGFDNGTKTNGRANGECSKEKEVIDKKEKILVSKTCKSNKFFFEYKSIAID